MKAYIPQTQTQAGSTTGGGGEDHIHYYPVAEFGELIFSDDGDLIMEEGEP